MWLYFFRLRSPTALQITRVVITPHGHNYYSIGQTHSLPELFHSKPAILVVGFSPESKEQARLWSKQLIDAVPGQGNVYNLVMLARVPRLLRGYALHEIREDVSASIQSRFLVITADDQQWRELADVESLQDAYLLVADGQGFIRWWSHESFSVVVLARTREALRRAEFAYWLQL